MRRYLTIAGLCLLISLSLQGCIPLMVGGFIGYKMSEHDAHNTWCAGHPGDTSCHP